MKKRILVVLLTGILVCSIGVSVSAAGNTKAGIKSSGRMHFNNKTSDDISDDVIFDAEDFIHIADRVDVLIEVSK